MANPTTFQPLLTRLNEMFLSGSGVTPTNDPNVSGTYAIATGSFDAQFWYEGKEVEALATSAIYKPQLKFSITQVSIPGAWNANYFEKLYNITLAVDMAYYTNAKLLKEKKDELMIELTTDVISIIKALTKPNNLTQTNASVDTGLIGGCFFDNSAAITEFVWNPETSLLTSRLTIDGKVVLAN
jgi:hypothetical protein